MTRNNALPLRAALSFLVFAAGGAVLGHFQGGLSWPTAFAISPVAGILGVLTFGWRELIALFNLAPSIIDSALAAASRAVDLMQRSANAALDAFQAALTCSRRLTAGVKAFLDLVANWLDPSDTKKPPGGKK